MSLVEGYGNLVMNLVGRRLLPGFSQLEAAYARRSRRRGALEVLFWRLTGLELKLQQYRLGEAFSRTIHDRHGMAVLNRAWESPDTLPRPEELRDPDRWYRRVVLGEEPGRHLAIAPAPL
jgi:putative hydrolase